MTARLLASLLAVALAAPLAASAAPKKKKSADTVPPAILAQPPRVPGVGEPIQIECQIVDESPIFEPTLYWRATGATDFEPIKLDKQEGNNFMASFAPPVGVREIEYFVEAYDAEGNGPARFGAPNLALKLQLKPPLSTSTVKPPAPPAATDDAEHAELELPEPASGPAAWRQPLAYVLLGVGVLLTGGGVYELGSHRSAATDFNARFEKEGFYDATKRTEIESQGKRGSGLLGAGLAVAAAGGVLLVVEF